MLSLDLEPRWWACLHWGTTLAQAREPARWINCSGGHVSSWSRRLPTNPASPSRGSHNHRHNGRSCQGRGTTPSMAPRNPSPATAAHPASSWRIDGVTAKDAEVASWEVGGTSMWRRKRAAAFSPESSTPFLSGGDGATTGGRLVSHQTFFSQSFFLVVEKEYFKSPSHCVTPWL